MNIENFNQYLRSFVIGSSFMVFIGFFIRVYTLAEKNYSYFIYTVIAPLYLGMMNALSLFLQKQYNLTNKERYGYITAISVLVVWTFAKYNRAYNHVGIENLYYMGRLAILHGVAYGVIMRFLENNI